MKKIVLVLCALLLTASMSFAENIPVSADVADFVRIGPRDNDPNPCPCELGDIYWNDTNADGVLGNEVLHPDGSSDRWATLVVYANTAKTYTLTITGNFTLVGPGGATVPYDIKIDGMPTGQRYISWSKMGTMCFPVQGYISPAVPTTSGHYIDTLTATVAF